MFRQDVASVSTAASLMYFRALCVSDTRTENGFRVQVKSTTLSFNFSFFIVFQQQPVVPIEGFSSNTMMVVILSMPDTTYMC